MSYTDMAAFCVSEFEHVLTTFLAKNKTSKAMLSATHPKRRFFLTNNFLSKAVGNRREKSGSNH